MDVSSAGTSPLAYLAQTATPPESAEPRSGGPDNDGDLDDSIGVTAPPTTTVNALGQTVGQLINVSA